MLPTSILPTSTDLHFVPMVPAVRCHQAAQMQKRLTAGLQGSSSTRHNEILTRIFFFFVLSESALPLSMPVLEWSAYSGIAGPNADSLINCWHRGHSRANTITLRAPIKRHKKTPNHQHTLSHCSRQTVVPLVRYPCARRIPPFLFSRSKRKAWPT